MRGNRLLDLSLYRVLRANHTLGYTKRHLFSGITPGKALVGHASGSVSQLLRNASKNRIQLIQGLDTEKDGIVLQNEDIPNTNASVLSRYVVQNNEIISSDPVKSFNILEQLVKKECSDTQILGLLLESIENDSSKVEPERIIELVRTISLFGNSYTSTKLFNLLIPVLSNVVPRLADYEVLQLCNSASFLGSTVSIPTRKLFLSRVADIMSSHLHSYSATDLFKLLKVFRTQNVEVPTNTLEEASMKLRNRFQMIISGKQFVATAKAVQTVFFLCNQQDIDEVWLDEFEELAENWLCEKFIGSSNSWSEPETFAMFKHSLKALSVIDKVSVKHLQFVSSVFSMPLRFENYYPFFTFQDKLFFLDILRNAPNPDSFRQAQDFLQQLITEQSNDVDHHDMIVFFKYLSKWFMEAKTQSYHSDLDFDKIINVSEISLVRILESGLISISDAVSLFESLSKCRKYLSKKVREAFSQFLRARTQIMDSHDMVRLIASLEDSQLLLNEVMIKSCDKLSEQMSKLSSEDIIYVLRHFSRSKIRNEILFYAANDCLQHRLSGLSDSQIASLCHSIFFVGITGRELFSEGKTRLLQNQDGSLNLLDSINIAWACAGSEMFTDEILQKLWECMERSDSSQLNALEPVVKRRIFQIVSYHLACQGQSYSPSWEMKPSPSKSIVPFLQECADASVTHSSAMPNDRFLKSLREVFNKESSVSILEEQYSDVDTFGYEFLFVVNYKADEEQAEPIKLAIDIYNPSECAQKRTTPLGEYLLRRKTLQKHGWSIVNIPSKALLNSRKDPELLSRVIMTELHYHAEILRSASEDNENFRWEKAMRRIADSPLPEK